MQLITPEVQAAAPRFERFWKRSRLGAHRPYKLMRISIRRSLSLAIGFNLLWAFIMALSVYMLPACALPVIGHLGLGVPKGLRADWIPNQHALHRGRLDSEEHCGEFDRVVSSSRGRFFAELASNYNVANLRRVNAHRHSRTVFKPVARVCKDLNEPLAANRDGLFMDGQLPFLQLAPPHSAMPFEEHALRLDALRETQVLYARPAAEWHDEL